MRRVREVRLTWAAHKRFIGEVTRLAVEAMLWGWRIAEGDAYDETYCRGDNDIMTITAKLNGSPRPITVSVSFDPEEWTYGT